MAIKPITTTGTVTTAGTRAQLTASATYATSVYFEAAQSSVNTGLVYVGDSTVSSTVYFAALSPGQGINISIDVSPTRTSDANGGPELNLATFYIDAQTSGNTVHMTYLQRLGNS